jgi:hypothetical protein
MIGKAYLLCCSATRRSSGWQLFGAALCARTRTEVSNYLKITNEFIGRGKHHVPDATHGAKENMTITEPP